MDIFIVVLVANEEVNLTLNMHKLILYKNFTMFCYTFISVCSTLMSTQTFKKVLVSN